MRARVAELEDERDDAQRRAADAADAAIEAMHDRDEWQEDAQQMVIEERARSDELEDLLFEVVLQSCLSSDARLHSHGITSYSDAIRALAEAGRARIVIDRADLVADVEDRDEVQG